MERIKPVIGVTGPSGSGKSKFCASLSQRGYLWLDCDRIYHELISAGTPLTRELSGPEAFGPSILAPDGSIDRRTLASAVFAPGAEDRLILLNKITHRYVKLEINRRMRAAAGSGFAGCVIDAPLLFEAGMKKKCDLTVAVLAPLGTRLSRLKERDRLPEDRLLERLAASKDDGWYVRRADEVIINDGSAEKLEAAADEIAARFAKG